MLIVNHSSVRESPSIVYPWQQVSSGLQTDNSELLQLNFSNRHKRQSPRNSPAISTSPLQHLPKMSHFAAVFYFVQMFGLGSLCQLLSKLCFINILIRTNMNKIVSQKPYAKMHHFVSLNFFNVFHIFFILQLQGRPYKSMKESLSLSEPMQQLILEAYTEKTLKYLSQIRRKGTQPIRQDEHNTQTIARSRGQEQDRKNFPYSAFGIVKISTQNGVRVSAGAIIHPHLIITAAPPSIPPTTSFQFTPLTQLAQNVPLAIKKTHPNNLEIIRSSDQLNIGQQGSEQEASHCIVLETSRKLNLEEEHGSFSISFEEETPINYALLGLQNIDGQYKLCEQPIEVSTTSHHLSYPLYLGQNCLPGSLVVSRSRGYQIKGIHLGMRGGRGLAVRLIKTRWHQFSKMTYKGGSFDIAHENMGRKGINFLTQLNLKKVCELYLEKTGLNSEDVGIICNQNFQLTQLNLSLNGIGDDGLHVLAQAKWPLEQIYLSRNALSWEGMRSLSANRWRNMVHVQLNENPIGNRGVRFLVQCDWSNLRTICMNKIQLDDSGCDHLRKAVWPCLTLIDLDHNKIGIKGALFLTNAAWRNLSHVNLASNKLGSLGVKQLLRGEWKNMAAIRIQRNESGDRHAMNSVRHLIKDKFKRVYIV